MNILPEPVMSSEGMVCLADTHSTLVHKPVNRDGRVSRVVAMDWKRFPVV